MPLLLESYARCAIDVEAVRAPAARFGIHLRQAAPWTRARRATRLASPINTSHVSPRREHHVVRGWPWDGLFQTGEKFASVNVDEDAGVLGTDERFGEPSLLLLGFQQDEVAPIRAMLHDLGASFVQVLLCTGDMFEGTLQAALEQEQEDPALVQPAEGCPRIMFIAGLSSGETIQVMDEYQEANLVPAIFAAAVPNSMGKNIRQLATEIEGDHAEATKAQAS